MWSTALYRGVGRDRWLWHCDVELGRVARVTADRIHWRFSFSHYGGYRCGSRVFIPGNHSLVPPQVTPEVQRQSLIMSYLPFHLRYSVLSDLEKTTIFQTATVLCMILRPRNHNQTWGRQRCWPREVEEVFTWVIKRLKYISGRVSSSSNVASCQV